MPWGTSLPTAFGSAALVRAVALREAIDVVHAHQNCSALAHEAVHAARALGIPCAFTDHSLFGFADTASILTNQLLRCVGMRALQRGCNDARWRSLSDRGCVIDRRMLLLARFCACPARQWPAPTAGGLWRRFRRWCVYPTSRRRTQCCAVACGQSWCTSFPMPWMPSNLRPARRRTLARDLVRATDMRATAKPTSAAVAKSRPARLMTLEALVQMYLPPTLT